MEQRLYLDEVGEYTTYGIRALKVTLFGTLEIDFVSDVSTDHELVRELTDHCTKGQLHPIHLMDVIEDVI